MCCNYYYIMPFLCDKCRKWFKTNFLLSRHKNSKKSCIQEPVIYKCECGYTTDHKGNYEKHLARKTPCTRKTSEIEELKTIIKEMSENQTKTLAKLEKTAKQAAKRPTINYNFIVNNFNNALNIEDCLSMENITEDIIDKCKKLPLKDGSTYILNSLCDIDPKIRPIHCTDANRQNFVVRSEDTWSVDNKGNTIKSHIKPVVTDVYNDIYKDKLKDSGTLDDRIKLSETMSKELMSGHIEKSCNNTIKTTAAKFAVKNIDDEITPMIIDTEEAE